MKASSQISDAIGLFILLLILSGAGYYVYATRPCAQTIYYRVGTFDTQFGLSRTDFLAMAQAAANLWNAEAGHTVLAYSDTGSMPVNLVFDSRQQQANLGDSITAKETELTTEKAQVQAIQSQYDSMLARFQADTAAQKDVQTLNAEADSLNQLSAQIKSQAAQLNGQIAATNASANAYNQQAGEFEEGEFIEEYGSSRINLYEFKNTTQLERLMAHEFGHSLGLDHNANPDSIMYPENTATTLSLSAEDAAELHARCDLSLANLNPFKWVPSAAK